MHWTYFVFVFVLLFTIIVDEDRGSDVHGVNEAEALLDATLSEALLDLRGDVDKVHPRRDGEPELLSERLHIL